MKQLIALVMLALVALLAFGCAPKVKEAAKEKAEQPSLADDEAEPAAPPGTVAEMPTETSVAEIEKELDEIDALDKELDMSGLDSLEQDLAEN